MSFPLQEKNSIPRLIRSIKSQYSDFIRNNIPVVPILRCEKDYIWFLNEDYVDIQDFEPQSILSEKIALLLLSLHKANLSHGNLSINSFKMKDDNIFFYDLSGNTNYDRAFVAQDIILLKRADFMDKKLKDVFYKAFEIYKKFCPKHVLKDVLNLEKSGRYKRKY